MCTNNTSYNCPSPAMEGGGACGEDSPPLPCSSLGIDGCWEKQEGFIAGVRCLCSHN